jgi:hypothetical protein
MFWLGELGRWPMFMTNSIFWLNSLAASLIESKSLKLTIKRRITAAARRSALVFSRLFVLEAISSSRNRLSDDVWSLSWGLRFAVAFLL